MKTGRMLTILVLALGLMFWPTDLAGAEPLGTAFAYQGRLMDASSPADAKTRRVSISTFPFLSRRSSGPSEADGTTAGSPC